MADDFDPCECINMLNHEARMQRLMSMLRNSQSYCTDSECVDDGSIQGGQVQATFWPFLIGWALLLVILFFMRPASRRTDAKGNRSGNGGGRDHDFEPVL